MTQFSEGLALNLVGMFVKNRYYADHRLDYATQQCLEGFGALDLPQEIAGYKPRPLAGARRRRRSCTTARCPRSIKCCCRPNGATEFFVGPREFDPVHVGYVTEPDAESKDDGFWLDTGLEGNRNIRSHLSRLMPPRGGNIWRTPKANPLPSGVIGPEFTDEQRFAFVRSEGASGPALDASRLPAAKLPFGRRVVVTETFAYAWGGEHE